MPLLRIATRKSLLAMWQSEYVAARLRMLRPDLDVVLVPMSTRGDEILDRSLAAIGGKGLFLKELELAMLRGDADCAVHSLKDVPMDLEPPFMLAAVLSRDDPADALISNVYLSLESLPIGARVATSSLRRQAQLRFYRPDLRLFDLRGNVNTRLAKLDNGDYDAIVLACAGLRRLGLEQRMTARLAPPEWLPAPGQGAIAVESLTEDARIGTLLAGLDDLPTRQCVVAERTMNRALHGSCHVPVGAYASYEVGGMRLQGLVGCVADGRLVRAELCSAKDEGDMLGRAVAQCLLDAGAAELLAATA
ncbi:hydroxymethylbilane synthase [Xylella fastidiosa]|uniref:Porphobilinogen deaminase n=2 Tax=Xylella fastidiosa TaxID=2371 RepID=HEM3_XYLFA|nr:hydroxymethylbilane synthase [Xylella fastidiosa]Q9PCX7.1 RecName: Full=Porphobilinogen deaminase; Short=PBG; AltName: Full=Hydroxymethylbilane synthase; Short=HMBS; AltName: Full=Pre-uroporphyrinogen synthase [Xylella fastidiosa 9a5c]AAF84436.1 hydroxymethylbilane synthase [Xylella fastidiosa 9a5c]ALQ94930.1 porphobilinogen deaminase [Xylella fastidiosa]ALQ97092.1 hydroxymethylbilane synthase [Xylella fastidiosa]ALR02194.1 porphobilinogen deaminase [Xylella fastidiosa]ALR04237.1 hydroxyme